jgi:hypothetical protein
MYSDGWRQFRMSVPAPRPPDVVVYRFVVPRYERGAVVFLRPLPPETTANDVLVRRRTRGRGQGAADQPAGPCRPQRGRPGPCTRLCCRRRVGRAGGRGEGMRTLAWWWVWADTAAAAGLGGYARVRYYTVEAAQAAAALARRGALRVCGVPVHVRRACAALVRPWRAVSASPRPLQ